MLTFFSHSSFLYYTLSFAAIVVSMCNAVCVMGVMYAGATAVPVPLSVLEGKSIDQLIDQIQHYVTTTEAVAAVGFPSNIPLGSLVSVEMLTPTELSSRQEGVSCVPPSCPGAVLLLPDGPHTTPCSPMISVISQPDLLRCAEHMRVLLDARRSAGFNVHIVVLFFN